MLLGNGDGTFQPAVDATRSGPYPVQRSWRGTSPAMATLDLAVTDDASTDGVSMLLGNGDGTFQPPVTYAVGPSAVAIVAGDFNGDGRARPRRRSTATCNGDHCSLGAAGQRRRHVPARRRRTQRDVSPMPSWRATSPATGSLDLAVAERDPSNTAVSVLLGNGDGTFSLPGQSATTPTANAAGGRRQRRRHRRRPGRRRRRRYPLSPGHPRPARHLRAARHGQPRLTRLARHRLGARHRSRPAAGQRRRPGRRRLALRLSRRRSSSGSDRWRPASSRRRSSRPT